MTIFTKIQLTFDLWVENGYMHIDYVYFGTFNGDFSTLSTLVR